MQLRNLMKPISTLPLVALLLVAAAGIYWLKTDTGKDEAPAAQAAAAANPFKALAAGPLAAFIVHPAPKEMEGFTFKDGTGAETSLAKWKGKVVLLNLWATWCLPCRKEMPDLAALQKELGGSDFEVVALSVDRKGAEASSAFLKEVNASSLALYTDEQSKSLQALQAIGLPATLLIGRDGREIGRLLGPAEWASDEAKALVRAAMAARP